MLKKTPNVLFLVMFDFDLTDDAVLSVNLSRFYNLYLLYIVNVDIMIRIIFLRLSY